MANKRNLIFICSDQQRTDSLGCYGNDWIETPNLNALADGGFVFENPYVMQAVCTPARATMLTGLYPHSAGVVRNSQPGRPQSNLTPDVKTVAEMVSDDYLCAYFGKWHLGDDLTPQHGFERWISVEDAHDANFPNYTRKENRHRTSDYFKFLEGHGYTPEGQSGEHRSFTQRQRGYLPEEHAMCTFLGDNAAEFIREQAEADQPFIMFVMMFEPHPPYNGPLNDMYDPESIPDGPLFLKKPADNCSLFSRLRADYYMQGEAENQNLDTPADWRALRARYYGNVTLLDRGVGRVLNALSETGLDENTAVIFTSDHGDSLGDRGMLNKRSFYEEVSRVPLIMRVPWLGGGQRVPGSIGQVDLVPTILDLLDQPVPDHLQGESRVPVLRGDATLENNDVFMQWHGGPPTVNLGDEAVHLMSAVPWRSVVTGDRWKLNLSPGDQCELFDLNSDPLEEVNLFDEPAHRDRVRQMTARIRLWQYRTEDDLVLPMV